jgi:hypothetical protein
MDFKTCSTCADTCMTTAMQANNETCVGTGVNGCAWWAAGCRAKAMPQHCTGLTTSSLCTASPFCYWLAYERTACGATVSDKVGACYPCNTTVGSPTGATPTYVSAFKTMQGRQCTWATADSTSGSPFVLKITEVSQNAQCTAFTKSMGDLVDLPLLSASAATGVFTTGAHFPVNAGTKPTCTAVGNTAVLVGPSLAILGLVAVFLA